jgi:superfamily I DNA/RNA helicase
MDELLEEWRGFVDSLPQGMTLGETLGFLGANDEVEQRAILDGTAVRSREVEPDRAPPKRVRILTMHGAKGLSGKIVFLPSLEQGVLPSFKAINATGLLNEQRRLLYDEGKGGLHTEPRRSAQRRTGTPVAANSVRHANPVSVPQ